MQDPFGTVLSVLRADTPLTAVVPPDSISAVASDPPSVRLVSMPTNLRPFGPGSGHIGMQGWQALAQCYGPNDPTGPILARQVAGLVADALHGAGPVYGATAFLLRAWTPDISEVLRDPDHDWVYHEVRIEAYAASEAVT
jgi:hypothetical protein